MPEVGKEQDPGLSDSAPQDEVYQNVPDEDAMKEDSAPPDGPKVLTDNPKEATPPTLAPEVEAAFRKIAKEEIGKALGHTIV